MARRAAYRKRRQNKFGMFLVFIVVVMLTVVVAVRGIEMKAKLADNRQREAELEAQHDGHEHHRHARRISQANPFDLVLLLHWKALFSFLSVFQKAPKHGLQFSRSCPSGG